MEPRCPPCATISHAARDFISQSGAAVWEDVDLTPEGLTALRLETSHIAAPGCQAVQSELGAVVKDGQIGGVPVLWVLPQGVRGPEVILYMHGGGFISGCPEDDVSIFARLADILGRRVCAPRYRLAPEYPFPAACDDAMTVYRGLVDGVVVVGQSAGGNLALGVVLRGEAAGLSPPKAVALLSPWADLSHSGDSHAILTDLDPTLSVKHFLEPASLAYAGGRFLASPEISPLFDDFPANFPPTIISTATRDLLLSDSVRLAAKLRAVGCAVDLHVAEGLWHAFEWHTDIPEAAESVREIASFLSQHLP